MQEQIIEVLYPIYFRKDDALKLGRHIKNRHSLTVLGIKRIGISNFLRFFIYHQAIVKTYLQDDNKYLFIPVDLFDLIERELVPFWVLTFKRIVDSVQSSTLDSSVKEEIQRLFLESIQLNDQFLLIENIKKTITKIIDQGFLPTIFFLRFDRMTEVATEDLFANLNGLQDFTHNALTFVFTGYKPLPDLMKSAKRLTIAAFTEELYVKPALKEDRKVILDIFQVRYNLTLTKQQEDDLLEFSGGHTRYLQLELIILHEQEKSIEGHKLFELLTSDERITLQSEELWENLTKEEQTVLRKVALSEKLSNQDLDKGRYLFEAGFIIEEENKFEIFSSLFADYIKSKPAQEQTNEITAEFTKKELALYNFLKENLGEVCERESIIEAVWSDEEEALEVSDWAMDRLVARVRNKVKKQNTPFEIITVRTRGYKLVES